MSAPQDDGTVQTSGPWVREYNTEWCSKQDRTLEYSGKVIAFSWQIKPICNVEKLWSLALTVLNIPPQTGWFNPKKELCRWLLRSFCLFIKTTYMCCTETGWAHRKQTWSISSCSLLILKMFVLSIHLKLDRKANMDEHGPNWLAGGWGGKPPIHMYCLGTVNYD